MSTAISPDVFSIEELDFDATCEVVWGKRDGYKIPCENPAKYLIRFYSHQENSVIKKLSCHSCYTGICTHMIFCRVCPDDSLKILKMMD